MNRKAIYLFYAFLFWFGAMLVFSLFYSSGSSELSIDEPNYNVLQSDEIYFRNIRASQYFIEEDSASGFDLLKAKSLSEDSQFCFVIVRNWRQRLAYIMPDRDSRYTQVVIQGHIARKLKDMNMDYNWETAVITFNAIRSGDELKLLSGDAEYLPDDEELKQLKNTIKDYLKLTNSLP